MTAISAVIITRNEERNIKRCLDSLKNVVDEIIIVDSHSTDNTAAICREAGARVIVQEWLGFGPQKNAGNQAASFDYILSIDADEALDEELAASIVEAKQRELQGVYEFTRLNYYYGKFMRHGVEYPDFKTRLFPRSQVQWKSEHVHETLMIPPGAIKTRLKGHLLHYTYLTIQEHIAKANTYTTLAAIHNHEKGKSVSWLKIIFGPFFTFIQAYIFKRGFLDGSHGFVLAVFHAYATFIKYVKLWHLKKDDKKV